ncbi:MAG TPA: response regulator transcription factor [Trichormus sp.]|jgi:OmpR-family two-component system manganese-sensing response regulator
MAKILLVEDDASAAQFAITWLTDENYLVEWASDGAKALDLLAIADFDVILLDWELPKHSGFEILRHLRDKGNRTPVIMLTGKSTVKDKEMGLDGGADDYLAKPYDLSELCARIRVQLRKSATTAGDKLTLRDITLDPREFRVTKGGKAVDLLPKEFMLLEFFLRNPDRVFSADAVMRRVWQSDSESTTNAFRSALKRLRRKLDPDETDPEIIETVHGVGYRLNSK